MISASLGRHALLWATVCFIVVREVVISREAQAQTVQPREVRLPVTIALVPKLPVKYAQYAAVVVRSSHAEIGDVLLLPRTTATGTLLVQTTHALVNARAIHGERPATMHGKSYENSVLGVKTNTNPPLVSSAEASAAERVVGLLLSSKAPRRVLAGVGDVPAVDMFPPRTPQRTP